MPTIYDPKPRRLWPHTLAIVAAALLLIVVLIWLCTVRGWLGAPECCCCGHVAVSSWPNVSASTVPASGVTTVSRGGAPTGGHPFATGGSVPSRRLYWLAAASPSSIAVLPAAGIAPTRTTAAIATTEESFAPPDMADITGELGDGGDTYVDTWLPPDDAPACQGICYQIGGTTPTPPVSVVPTPSTWVMMLFGFGLMGIALRARHVAV